MNIFRKLIRKLLKLDREDVSVPKSVQDAIPVKKIWGDGIFLVAKNKYSKSYKFTDINYAVASREDKESMFLDYSEILNSLDTGATSKITVVNRRINKLDFKENILLKLNDDELDEYREEYNKMLLEKATGANGIIQEKYLTITIEKKSIQEARSYFSRVYADLSTHFSELGSKLIDLDTKERMRLVYDFYREGEESSFEFNLKDFMRKGHNFKDYICPDVLEFDKSYIKIGDRYARALFLKSYASFIKDTMVAELTDLNKNLMMSIDVMPIPMDEA